MIKNNYLNIIIFFLLLILIIYLFKSFENLENEVYYKNCLAIKNLINLEFNKIKNFALDYGERDETVNFIINKNRYYIKSNFNYNTMKNIGIDFVVFFNKYKFFSYAYFKTNGDNLSISQQLFITKIKSRFFRYLSTPNQLKKFQTIEKINNVLYFFVFHPILKNSGKPPAYGTIVFGRKITKEFFLPIEKVILCKCKILPNSINFKNINIKKEMTGFIPLKNYENKIIATLKIIFPLNKRFIIIERSILICIIFIILLILYFISEKFKEKNIKIKKEQNIFLRAFNQVKTGIIITEFDGTIIYVNKIVCQHTGFKKEELIGNKSTLLLDEKILFKIFNEKLKNGELWKGEIYGKTKFGNKIDLEIAITPIFDEKNKIECFITSCEFISEQKRLLNELKKAKKEAEKFNKFKYSILTNLSHEVKTPLTGIIGFTDLLEKTELNKTQKQYCKYLKESAQKLMKLLNNFIELSKFDIEMLNIKPKPFSIIDFNKKIISKYKPEANKKGLTLEYSFDKKIPEKLIGDEKILERVLDIILDNAIKFTEHGNIYYINNLYSLNAEKAIIEFIIEDTGIGMEDEEILDVFNLFSIKNNNNKFNGMGIGLFLAKKYIENLNGKLEINSKKNQGTIVKIILEFNIFKEDYNENSFN